MNWINKMIAALYFQNKKSMKYSNPPAVLFISKLYFSLLFWFGILPFFMLLHRFIPKFNIFDYIPKFGFSLFLMLLPFYFLVDKFTWNKDEVLKYISDLDNSDEMKANIRIFFIFLIVLLIIGVIIGDYNKWHWIPE
jgi:hypothetical protein